MSDLPSRPAGAPTLTDRVMSRVIDAGLSVDRRTRATRPAAARRRPAATALSSDSTRTPAEVREVRSLRRVFEDLGLSYRQYRRDTGAPVSADVKDAATRFRRDLNVTSLVSVAACLDALDILSW